MLITLYLFQGTAIFYHRTTICRILRFKGTKLRSSNCQNKWESKLECGIPERFSLEPFGFKQNYAIQGTRFYWSAERKMAEKFLLNGQI